MYETSGAALTPTDLPNFHKSLLHRCFRDLDTNLSRHCPSRSAWILVTDNIVAGIRQKQCDSVGCVQAGVGVIVGGVASQGRSFHAVKLILVIRRADEGLTQWLLVFVGRRRRLVDVRDIPIPKCCDY